MVTKKQQRVAKKNIRKAQAAWKSMAVEVHGDDAVQWLDRAEDIFRQTGTKSLSLAE